ncbi:hypothetical protein F5Y07DRAFT_316809 [Xylaria sp. FL0933]|nr:hypothetical protein F5Y07DRAFT_316809 [Xylaria sp. FL0933]
MLFSIGRSATRRLASAAIATSSTRSVVFRATTKVQFGAPGFNRRFPQAIRGYATAGRPKKAPTSATTKKTPAKKPVKKSTAKPKAKAKAKAKPKPKPKPKQRATRAKKPVSEERKGILERQALRRAALFEEPKTQATTPWPLFIAEQTQGRKGIVTDKIAELSREYKALPSSELQRLKSKAEQAKASNEVNYKAWLESHSPQEIYEANLARKNLKRKYNIPKGPVKILLDHRLPKRPSTAYALFTKARWASGDYSGENGLASKALAIAQEWKKLTPAERKPFEDQAASETESYSKVINALVSRKRASDLHRHN